jgi:hypothetical protein
MNNKRQGSVQRPRIPRNTKMATIDPNREGNKENGRFRERSRTPNTNNLNNTIDMGGDYNLDNTRNMNGKETLQPKSLLGSKYSLGGPNTIDTGSNFRSRGGLN